MNAAEIKKKELEIIVKVEPLDSLEYFQSYLYFLDIQSKISSHLEEDKLFEIIDYAHKNQYSKLKRYAMAFLRSYHFENQKISELKTLYTERWPEELEKLKEDDPINFSKFEGMCHVQEGNSASAKACFDQMEEQLQRNGNPALKAISYIQLADIQKNYNNTKEALELAEKGYSEAIKSNYIPYQLQAINLMSQLNHANGNYKLAFDQYREYERMNSSFNRLAMNEEITTLRMITDQQIEEERKAKEQAETKKSHSVQYMIIFVVGCTIFILLMMLVKYNMPIWVIRVVGFISLVFIFEVLILLADTWIHHATHGSPLKIIGIKVVLISILLPLHHWVEHMVIKYLVKKRTDPQPFLSFDFGFIKKWFEHMGRQ